MQTIRDCRWLLVLGAIVVLLPQSTVAQLGVTDSTRTECRQNIPPLIEEQPDKEIPFKTGYSVQLSCVASGYPQPIYSWLMENKPFDPSGNDGRVAIQPGVGTLIITNLLETDEGVYQCIAENVVGRAITVRTFLKRAFLQPFPDPGTETRTYRPRLGEPLVLRCVPPVSYPRADLYWAIINGSRLIPIEFDDRITVDPEGNLRFANIRSTDSANGNTYVCIAQNPVVRHLEQGRYAIIQPQIQTVQYSAPEFVWHPNTESLTLRDNTISLTCVFSGYPTPVVTWQRVLPSLGNLPNTSRMEDYGQTLVIEGIKQADEGTYQCIGLNNETQTPLSRSVNLKVESSPSWIDIPESINTTINGSAEFQCRGEGLPEPEYKWFLNGVPLSKILDDNRRIVTRNVLTFTNISQADTMTIQCNITNKHGYMFANAYLNVLCENSQSSDTLTIVPSRLLSGLLSGLLVVFVFGVCSS